MDLALPPSVSPPTRTYTYELCARDALPSFDASITMKEFLLPAPLLRAYSRIMRRHGTLVTLGYIASLAVRVACFYAPARTGRALAPVAPLLQWPATIAVMMLWRVAYVRVLLRTFEFWYFLLLNTMWMIAFGALLGDRRVCVLPLIWLEFQNETLMDAYFASLQVILIAVLAAIAQLLALVVAVVFDLLDQAEHVELIGTTYRTLSTRDVLLYTTSSVIFLFGRMIYRRRAAAPGRRRSMRSKSMHSISPTPQRGSTENVRTVTSIAYQCKLVAKDETVAPTDTVRVASATRAASSAQLTMRLARTKRIVYQAPRAFHPLPWNLTRVVGSCLSLLSIACIVLSVLQIPTHSSQRQQEHRTVALLPLITVASTVAALVPWARLSSYRLLSQLVTSFDAVMLSIKLTAAHVCLCDMLRWQPNHCAPVICSWLWWHTVLTVDALPPLSKARLGIKLRAYVTPLLLLSAAAQVLLAGELLFWNAWGLRDRELVRFQVHLAKPKYVVFRVAPFLLSRLMAVFVWTWRLVFRAVNAQSDNDLLLLTGVVEYELPPRTRAQPAAPSSGPATLAAAT